MEDIPQSAFDGVDEFPDAEVRGHFSSLVGLDDMKDRLVKEASIMLDPSLLEKWSKKHHKKPIAALDYFRKRPPLFVLAGDVGTGKTSLAESFGAEVASREDLSVKLFRLSLRTRGSGMVGQSSTLLAKAFSEFIDQVTKMKSKTTGEKHSSGAILLIDEADTLAQSRELAHMHHEDRAGVNTLIRGIDSIASAKLPALVVMCSNRLDAIDPAVKRRAAAIFTFTRPNDEQRSTLLAQGLAGIELTSEDLEKLVKATGPSEGRQYGYTYSDITQKLLPHLVLSAYPDKPITIDDILKSANEIAPTPPFKEALA